MSDLVEIVALVEGPTERIFIQSVLAPYLARQEIFITPIVLSKPGQKGGDVKFARAKNDIGLHLKQRRDTQLTLFVDYYGIRGDWPGYAESKAEGRHEFKAEIMNRATHEQVNELFGDWDSARRFIPYVSMFEFEALLFSDPGILAAELAVRPERVEEILRECGSAEQINDSSITAPSKRLEFLSTRFKKTSTGIAIAQQIGIDQMRAKCPLFNGWLSKIEGLKH